MAAFPDNETRKIIEHYSGRIPVPEDRLEFVLRAMRAVRQDAPGSRPGIFGNWRRRLRTIDMLYRRYLLSGKLLRLGFGERVSRFVLRFSPLPPAAWKLSLAAVGLLVVFTQAAGVDFREPQVPPPAELETAKTSATRPKRNLEVWLVETEGHEELYSNGLRVSNQWLTHTGPRAYGVYEQGPGTEAREIDRRDRPAGIVFHTTESDLPVLEKTNNQSIRYEGRKLLTYIRGEHLYHFVIDRFGQVHRIVPETECAFHAGHSIWVDGSTCFAFGNGGQQFANMTGGDTRRPMHSGLLNPNEPRSLEMIEEALAKICGKAQPGEKICFSVPSAPPRKASDLTFHERTVRQMLEGLGYTVKSLNEGLAVVYAELEDASFTGVGISFGGGMCNVCIAYLGMPALSFCSVQAGDHIDTSTASVTSETAANVRLYKESGFSINGLSQKSIDQALSVYYCDMIRGIAERLEREAKNTKKLPRFDQAIPVAVSGGSALAGGFQQELEKALGNVSLPFEISQVKLAEDPFTSTAKGTLMAATLEM